MTIVQTIQTITDWIGENVCAKIKLKLPDDSNTSAEYTPTEVHPTAFAMFQPGTDKLPPNVLSPFPSVVVQLLEGTDKATEGSGTIKIQLSFTAWNPGDHGTEFKRATGVPTASGNTELAVNLASCEGQPAFSRNGGGWADVWSFVDRALQAIETTEYIGDVRVVKDNAITFGQFQQEGQISDLYPYWGAWVIFTIERATVKGDPLAKLL
jgi:hypothetical protein